MHLVIVDSVSIPAISARKKATWRKYAESWSCQAHLHRKAESLPRQEPHINLATPDDIARLILYKSQLLRAFIRKLSNLITVVLDVNSKRSPWKWIRGQLFL